MDVARRGTRRRPPGGPKGAWPRGRQVARDGSPEGPPTVQGCPLWLCSDHIGYILIVNRPLLIQLGSDMSLDVFTSSPELQEMSKAPKHITLPSWYPDY